MNTFDDTPSAPWSFRAPAAVLLGAACAGVAADRLRPMSYQAWSLLAGVALAAHCYSQWWTAPRRACARRFVAWSSRRQRSARPRNPGWALLGAVAGLAGAWHHTCSRPAPDDLAQLVTDEDRTRPVVIGGLADSELITTLSTSLADEPLASAAMGPRTRFRVRVGWLHRHGQWKVARGVAWVHVNGPCPALRPGDETVVMGNLVPYPPPMNPGEIDFQALHRDRGEFTYIEVPVADCVRVRPRPVTWRTCLPRLRVHWHDVLRRELQGEGATLAAALLLGVRDGFSGRVRDDFLMSGTSHVLAISGLHVSILAAPWLFAARARMLHFRGALASVVLIMALYAALAEGRAPVVRASVLVQVMCFSWLTRRRTSLANSLGLAGLIVLLINPTDLFRAGTQLSFLAVATLGRCHGLSGRAKSVDPLDQLIRRTRPWWSRTARRCTERLIELLLASLAVWLVTAPLAIQAFHIVAPVAIPLNLVLLPPVAIALQSGFALLLLADLCPPLAPLLAFVCQTSLEAMQSTVRTAAAWPGSHFWLVDPGPVAVLACYGCVGLTWAISHSRRRHCLGYLLAVACLLAGWGQKTWARYRCDNVRCSVLSVGHGTCVVLQWPGGPVWLYDAGSRGGIRAGEDRVARYLWAQGIGRLDAMILSHADLDHYSLMPGLIERFGVRRFYVGPPGLEADDPSEAWLVEELDRRGIVPKSIAAGDRFVFGTECALTVLHPESESQWSNDNARSLVLDLHYRGRSILLPGDLEADGLQSLLTRPSRVLDVAMAPHHGSSHSDPERFLRWCRPRWCIISDSKGANHSLWVTHSARRGTKLLHTGVHGAVEILLDNGDVCVQTFREGQL